MALRFVSGFIEKRLVSHYQAKIISSGSRLSFANKICTKIRCENVQLSKRTYMTTSPCSVAASNEPSRETRTDDECAKGGSSNSWTCPKCGNVCSPVDTITTNSQSVKCEKCHYCFTRQNISSVNRPAFDKGPFTWTSVLTGGGILVILTGFFMYLKREKQKKIEREKTRTFGKAAIGGSFELVDTSGKLRKSEEFLGRWTLIYFGFTHCPDVCPEELEKLAKVVEKLFKDKIDIVPLFISVDPERDTPELVGKYLQEFTDKFIGLTGTKEQVEKATRAYRIYYSVGPKDKDNDYIVDHTIISYLVDPKGELVDYFGQTKEASDIEAMIRYHIYSHK